MSEPVRIEAAASDGKKPKNPQVTGQAYAGGRVRLGGWYYPVVIDLEGLTIPANVPLLANHENRTVSRVGQVAATVESNSISIAGEITSSSDTARGIIDQAKAGADWQLSVGVEVEVAERVEQGSREINGQSQEAPFVHIKAGRLREVSVVAVGADINTDLHVQAKFNLGDFTMSKSIKSGADMASQEKEEINLDAPEKPLAEENLAEEKTETPPTIDVSAVASQAITAERQRVAAIRDICAGEYSDIEAEAIREGWDADKVYPKVLEATRSSRPQGDFSIHVRREGDLSTTKKTVEAALCLRAGFDEDELLKPYGEQAVEAAWKHREQSLRDVLCTSIRMEGGVVPSDTNSMIEAAFSTVSLPGMLSNVANKRMLKAFQAIDLVAPKLCSTGDLSDFKESDRYRLTDVGDLEPVAADGEIKDGGVTEEKATNQLDTYGKKFVLSRKMIYNDDLGAFLKFPIGMGQRAARKIDQLFFTRLLANPTQDDGSALFHATKHLNLTTGAGSALSHTSLSALITLFLNQVDADKQPITVEPKYLLVPTTLRHTAYQLVSSSHVVASGGDSTDGAEPVLIPSVNPIKQENLTPLSSPYLSNSQYTGYSATAWYLFGDPNQVDTFEIGYLRGKRTPTIEKGDTDFNTLGMWFRVFFDLGIREQDWRGMAKANGS